MKYVRTIQVKTDTANYKVVVQKGSLASLNGRASGRLLDHGVKSFVITSPEIWSLWSSKFLRSFGSNPPTVLFLPSGEKFKRVAQIERLTAELSAAGADRGSILFAFGGGVIGDVAGFVAAIYMRGIHYIQVPTTFLAQVDSSVGGKTGVNLVTGKNLIGAFHHPKAVFIDVETLATLPDEQLHAGLFESLKAGLIGDRALLNLMEREREAVLARDPALLERVIAASVKFKSGIVGKDERESGLRMVLNFGHTVGHAIESVAGFGKVLHGAAVGWGMIAALEISRIRGLPVKEFTRAVSLIRSYGLPQLPPLSASKLVAATARDKKNVAGLRRFVLLHSIGDAYVINDVTDAELQAGIAAMLKQAGA